MADVIEKDLTKVTSSDLAPITKPSSGTDKRYMRMVDKDGNSVDVEVSAFLRAAIRDELASILESGGASGGSVLSVIGGILKTRTDADLASVLGVPVLLSAGSSGSSPFRLICKFGKDKNVKTVILISYCKSQYQSKSDNFTHIATISSRPDSVSVGNRFVFEEMSEVGSSQFYIYDDGSNINVYFNFPNYGQGCYLFIIGNDNCDFSQFYATTSLTPQSEGVYRQ